MSADRSFVERFGLALLIVAENLESSRPHKIPGFCPKIACHDFLEILGVHRIEQCCVG